MVSLTPSVRIFLSNLCCQVLGLMHSPTATLNVIETLMNLTYLYYAHVGKWAPANLIGLYVYHFSWKACITPRH
jgi:hypothetical protein